MMPFENNRLPFDHNQILKRYWELANLDPSQTKDNITGQLHALDSLCAELARVPSAKPKTATAQPMEFYRSEWRKPS
jgi:hypothetical protein